MLKSARSSGLREQAKWLEQLGPKGPWLAERLLGMQGFPGDLDCDGKVAMLEDIPEVYDNITYRVAIE